MASIAVAWCALAVPGWGTPLGQRAAGTFSACLATDPGIDSTLDGLALVGLRQAGQLGIRTQVERAPTPGADVAAIRACLRRGARLTIGVGTQMANAVDAVATAHPERRFAVVDVDTTSLPHRPHNVTGIVFESEQAGYLVGYAAGLWARQDAAHGHRSVGAVGSIEVPPVDRYIAGFRSGARAADPGVTVLVEYGQDTTDPAKCRRSALDEIADGAGVLFEAAGACGEGVLQAAAAKRIPVIATDRPVPAASHWVLTVALKRVDVAVRASVLAAQLGRLRGGKNLRFGVAQDGVGYGAWGPLVSAGIREAVAAQLELLKARKVKGIPTTLG